MGEIETKTIGEIYVSEKFIYCPVNKPCLVKCISIASFALRSVITAGGYLSLAVKYHYHKQS